MLQHYFVDEQMFNLQGPLALLYRTFSKFTIERKLGHTLNSPAECLRGIVLLPGLHDLI